MFSLMSGLAFSKALATGSRAASTQTVIALSFSCSAEANPNLLSEPPPDEPEHPARRAIVAAEARRARLRVKRRCCDAMSHPFFLSTSLTTAPPTVAVRPLDHTCDV